MALVIAMLGASLALVTGIPRNDAALLAGMLLGIGLAGVVILRDRLRQRSAGRWTRSVVRIAVVGSAACTAAVKQELESHRIDRYRLVGHISPGVLDSAAAGSGEALGQLDELARLVEQHEIDLVLLTSEAPRIAVFDQLVRASDRVHVRAAELAFFHEEVFRQIALTEINAAWFQYVLHPRFRPTGKLTKRVFDVSFALVLGLGCVPLVLIVAPLIRLSAGPILFRQVRTGQNGRPFTLYKLRTMHPGAGDTAVWSPSDDPRVTAIGRIVRRFHLDELPQLYNVLRGDMSIVGPRPEQPELASRLEQKLPFYSCRHLVKPGITGWAQVRSGYAASDLGSAWKLSYDLYYLKHQSIVLDLAIMAKTIQAVVSGCNYPRLPDASLAMDVPQRPPAAAIPVPDASHAYSA
jgi:exopolysaccharide biosynthesis polyprenyl glycosylphosphotransferase